MMEYTNVRLTVVLCGRKFECVLSLCGARSFAGDPEDCCVGRAWHGRAAAGVGWRSGTAGVKKLYQNRQL